MASILPQSASFSPRFGSQIEDGRYILPYDQNLTASILPNLYIKYDKTPGSIAKSVEEVFRASKLKPHKQIQHVQDEIEAHCDIKIQLFYQQLLLCYKSHMILKGQNAEAQAGMKKGKSNRQLQEAHCATLPSIRCWTKEEEEASFAENSQPIQARSLAKDSYFFRSWNTTVKLPAIVNQTDSLIEFQTSYKELGNETFRQRCLTILNRVSQGVNTPREGLIRFLKDFLHVINFHLSKSANPTLLSYKKVVESYLESIQECGHLARLTFAKDPEKNFDLIQNKMWHQMKKEVDANQQIEKIKEQATEVLGNVHNKDRLASQILLRVAESKSSETNEDEEKKNSLLERAKNISRSEVLIYKQMDSLKKDQRIQSLLNSYFEAMGKDPNAIREDFKKNKGKWKHFFPQFKKLADVILKPKVKNLSTLFEQLVSHLYLSNHSADGRNIRKFLVLEGEASGSLLNKAQICAQNPLIRQLSENLVSSLRATD